MLTRSRSDEGSLVLTLVIVLALSMLVAVSVSSVIGGLPTAARSAQGAEAVAQAHAGLSDALFRLDQMGDNATSFCVGTPPADLLPSGLTSASCAPGGNEPLGSAAPGLRYYVVSEVTGTLPKGVTNELQLTSYGVAAGESRTITATLYEEASSYGFFGVSGFTLNGSIANAAVATVGGSTAATGSVLFGGGQSSYLSCNGGTGGTVTITGEGGFQQKSCGATSSSSNIEPAAPTMCAPGQLSTAFAPCIDASSSSDFATVGGSQFCPLPATGIDSSLQSASGVTSTNDSPDGLGTVFDCSSNGGPVTISTSTPAFGLKSIPSGNYYLDSNNVTIGNLDYTALANSTVNIFILAKSCGSGTSCAITAPSTPAACPSNPPGTDTSLTIGGNVNVNTSSPPSTKNNYKPPPPPPGDPGSLSIYWEAPVGSVLDGGSSSYWYDGSLYAPAADFVDTGNKAMNLYGSLILGCWTVDGGPNLTFAYPFHNTVPVLAWTVASYRITP
ncbi:MAG: hypothetical protein ACYCTE_03990 [Acidimicrobiales bacterium]